MAELDRATDETEAEWLEERILKLNYEALSAVAPLTMKEFILRRRGVRLWWD
jgi:hypothetical protein